MTEMDEKVGKSMSLFIPINPFFLLLLFKSYVDGPKVEREREREQMKRKRERDDERQT